MKFDFEAVGGRRQFEILGGRNINDDPRHWRIELITGHSDAFYVSGIDLNGLVSAYRRGIGKINYHAIGAGQLECAGREWRVGANFNFDPVFSAHNSYIADLSNARAAPAGGG